MKFTNGCWVVKPEYEMLFAVEVADVQASADTSRVLCVPKHIDHRADTVDTGALIVTLSTPMRDVVRVNITHFKGALNREPALSLYREVVTPAITNDEDRCAFGSGALTAEVCKQPGAFGIRFLADGRELTGIGPRGIARARDRRDGRSYLVNSLELDVGELVYGFGERFTPYVKNGQVVETWNEDGGTASEIAYKSIPFYMTNRGYGVYVESSGPVSFEVANEKVERVQFSLPGESLTYHVIYGATPKAILERYTALTGRPALPPAWSFGLWLSTSFTTAYDEASVTDMIDGMARRNIPLSVFHFDCFWMKGYHWCDFEWDRAAFPDPAGMLARLKARGLRVCLWMNPYVAQESRLFDEGAEKGYFITKTNGDVWQTDMWQAGMAVLDVTNPAARAWYCGHLKRLLDMGVDAFKTDFGERIPAEDVRYHDGSDPAPMHNFYPLLYNRMVFELLEQTRGKGEAVLFARSATAGGQQYPVHWGGDNSATYRSMAETLRAGLSISHSGFGFWSHDISGFEQTAPADVYKRWCAFGLLSSHSRLHGSRSLRVPWLFDEESCTVLERFTRLKCRLMPYLYRTAAEAHRVGTPMMRPMMLEFPGDRAVESCDTQYMLGDSLLVAPVFHADGHAEYYLPDGTWTHLLTGEVRIGGRWYHETFDFLSLPLYVREGAVLALGAEEGRPDYDYADGATLHAYEPTDGVAYAVTLCDTRGDDAARFTLAFHGDTAQVETDSQKPFHIVLHRGGQAIPIR